MSKAAPFTTPAEHACTYTLTGDCFQARQYTNYPIYLSSNNCSLPAQQGKVLFCFCFTALKMTHTIHF